MIGAALGRIFSIRNLGPIFFIATLVVPVGVALYLILLAEPPIPTTSAVLSTVNNVVEVQGVDNPAFQQAQEEQVLVAGDGVRTSDVGRGVITFVDTSTLVLEPSSELTILAPVRRGGGLINRISQSFGSSFAQFSSLAGGGRYEINTPAGVVSVRDGAVVRVGVGRSLAGQATVTVVVLEGQVEVTPVNAGESDAPVIVAAGQTLTATEGEPIPAPEPFVPINDIVIRLFSPFLMLVSEPGTGLTTGLIPPGRAVIQIPLSLTTAAGIEPQTVRLNEPVAGTYTIFLVPIGEAGQFLVTADGTTNAGDVFADSIGGETLGCEWLYLTLQVDIDASGLLSFGDLQGPFELTSIPFVFGQDYEADCPDPAPRQAQVGGAVATPPPPEPTPAAPPTPEPEAPPPPPPPPPPDVPPPTPVIEPTQPPVVIEPTLEPELEPTIVPTLPPDDLPPEEPPPPPPPPNLPPDISIGHVEENAAAPFLPAGPLAVMLVPAIFLAAAGALRKGRRDR